MTMLTSKHIQPVMTWHVAIHHSA